MWSPKCCQEASTPPLSSPGPDDGGLLVVCVLLASSVGRLLAALVACGCKQYRRAGSKPTELDLDFGSAVPYFEQLQRSGVETPPPKSGKRRRRSGEGSLQHLAVSAGHWE